jgi:hypothetical protein
MPIFIRQAAEFTLPRTADSLSLSRLSRRRNTAELQDHVLSALPRIPRLVLRGHSDISRLGTDSFLISTSPIERALTIEDVSGPKFLAKLYVTVSLAFGYAHNHARMIPDSKSLMLSLHLLFHGDGDIGNRLSSTVPFGIYHTPVADPGLPIDEVPETFPHVDLTQRDVLLARLSYDKRPYFASLNDAVSRDLEIHFFMRRNAIVYRDMLKVFTLFFKPE